eukprot:410018-Ditylum_brightwellii.AAC.1
MNSKTKEKPPRLAIANGWRIGYVPESIIHPISDILSAMIAPIRPFACVFSYSGGAHKAMKGASPHIYIVLCGRFTPNQRKILQDKTCVDLQEFDVLLNWMINHGHPAFSEVQPLVECPKPLLVQE